MSGSERMCRCRAPQFRHRRSTASGLSTPSPRSYPSSWTSSLYRIDQTYQGATGPLRRTVSDPKTMASTRGSSRRSLRSRRDVEARRTWCTARRRCRASPRGAQHCQASADRLARTPSTGDLSGDASDVPPSAIVPACQTTWRPQRFTQMKDAVEISSRERPDARSTSSPRSHSSADPTVLVSSNGRRATTTTSSDPIIQVYDYVALDQGWKTSRRRQADQPRKPRRSAHVICDIATRTGSSGERH